MLDKIWILCSLVIPSVLLFRPKKPCRKCCEVFNRDSSVLEKDEKEILIVSMELQHTETAWGFSDALVKLNFATPRIVEPGLQPQERVEPPWEAGEGTKFGGFGRGLGTPVGLGCLPAPCTSRGSSASTGDSPHPATGNVSRRGTAVEQPPAAAALSKHQLCPCPQLPVVVSYQAPWQTSSYSWHRCLVSPFECIKQYFCKHCIHEHNKKKNRSTQNRFIIERSSICFPTKALFQVLRADTQLLQIATLYRHSELILNSQIYGNFSFSNITHVVEHSNCNYLFCGVHRWLEQVGDALCKTTGRHPAGAGKRRLCSWWMRPTNISAW